MADPIVIQVKLKTDEISRAGQEISRKLANALDVGATAAQKRYEQFASQVQMAMLAKERVHAQKLEAIHAQSAARLQQIEARRQAQIDAIRERALQKELEHARRLERTMQSSARGVSSLRSAIGGLQGAFAAFAALGAVSLFENIARRAIDAALSIDQQVNSLKALTGSAEAATRRFTELVNIAQRTPGLTTNLALTLDTQLRILNVTEQTINRILPTIGRLNAIAPLGDPNRFVGNLVQLITQNFERQDLKELVGNSPFAGELIKELFNVNSPTNANAIREAAKRLGIRTVDDFFTQLAATAENNPRLRAVQESLGTQLEKIRDRLQVALAPVGTELARTLLPIYSDIVRAVERYGGSAARIFAENRNDIISTAREVGLLAVEFGKLFGSLASSPKIRELFGMLSIEAARTRDVLNAPAGNRLGLLFGFKKGPAQLEAERTIRENEAAAAFPNGYQPNMRIDFSEESRAAAEAYAKFIAAGGGRGRSAGALTSGSTGGAAIRPRLILPTLTADELISSDQAFRAMIAEQESALFRGRVRRAELTAEFEAAERRERLGHGRLSRAALTEDFERQEEAIKRAQEALKALPPVLSNGERFMRGFSQAIETTGDAFDRLGQNIANSFRDVGSLLDNLKNAVLGFFNDLLGQSLQRVVGQVLSPIAVAFGGGGGFALPGGGNLFRTPSTFPQSISSSAIQNLFSGAGGGIGVPPSVTQQAQLAQVFSSIAGEVSGPATRPRRVTGAAGFFNRFDLGGIFGGLASAAPLLGLSLGTGFGGQSRLGQVLGAGAGLGLGLGISFAAPILAEGGLAALGPAALAFAGPAAFIAAPLIVGAIFAGRAAQRRKDEEASGEFLRQALQQIDQLAAGVGSGQIPGSEARGIFDNQILTPFIQQINTLKTESVRKSRLTNQVRDLRNVYEARIPPLIAEQEERRRAAEQTLEARRLLDSRLVPEFATGGRVPGSPYERRLIFAHGDELIINRSQQTAGLLMEAIRAGVPGATTPTTPPAIAPNTPSAQTQNVQVEIHLGTETQDQLFINGMTSENTRTATKKTLNSIFRYG